MYNRQVMIETLHKIALKDSSVYFVCMDGMETTHFNEIKKDIAQNRIINCGISEQNAIGFAAGLALQGKKVYVVGCASFLVSRAYEQIKLDLAYNNANVKILAIKSGVASDPIAGYSHWEIEDIALISELPNTRVINCSTINEMEHYLKESASYSGFMYIMDENPSNNFNVAYKIESNKISRVIDGEDFAIVTTGNALRHGWDLARYFHSKGKKPILLNVHSIKPFDEKCIVDLINKNIPIVTIDEHNAAGLTSIVSRIIAISGKAVRYLPICVECKNVNIVGYYDYVMSRISNKDSSIVDIEKLIEGHRFSYKLRLYAKKVSILKEDKIKIRYSFLGVPVLKVVSRKRSKLGRLNHKYYLFGFIRII